MEVKISWDATQFHAAVQFIIKNNPHFINRIEKVTDSIKQSIYRLAENTDLTSDGTMGYIVQVIDRRFEGIDDDQNYCFVEILVDPAVGCPADETIYVEEVYVTDEGAGI